MRVMLDTNILISTALFPDGMAAHAFRKALMPPFEPVVCDYIIDELQRKFREKFSNRSSSLEMFMNSALPHIVVIPTPKTRREEEKQIRDNSRFENSKRPRISVHGIEMAVPSSIR